MLSAGINTLIYAVGVVILVSALAVPLSFLLTRVAFASRTWLSAVLTFPASLPALLLAMGTFDLWGQWVTGALGTIAVTAVAYVPWMLQPLARALERCDPALEEAARIAGARPLQAFLRASWPLVRREYTAAASLVFAMTGATFAVPYFLGTLGHSPFPTLTTEMVEVLALGEGFGAAFLLSVPLVVIAWVTTWISARLERGAIADVGRPAQALRTAPGRALRTGIGAAWLYAAVAIFAPLLALAARATASDQNAAWTSPRSLAVFIAMFRHGHIARAVFDSIVLASVSAAVIFVLALVIAISGEHRQLRRFFALVYALPGTLVALVLLAFAAAQVRLVIANTLTIAVALQNTLALLGLAYIAKYLSAGIETTRAALMRVAPTLVEAARLCGASPRRAAWDIRFPLARPAMLATTALLWMTFLPELTLSVLLFGPETPTLGTALFDLATYTSPSEAAALAVVLSASCIVLHTLIGRRSVRV